jgi:predicted GNAT family N-acyltransferase
MHRKKTANGVRSATSTCGRIAVRAAYFATVRRTGERKVPYGTWRNTWTQAASPKVFRHFSCPINLSGKWVFISPAEAIMVYEVLTTRAGNMSLPQKEMIRDEVVAGTRYGRHKLDELNASRVARHLVLFHPDDAAVADLMAKARPSIPGLGKTETIQNVLRHGFGQMFGVARKSKFNTTAPEGEGFILILPLNEIGLLQLALGTINGPDPDFRLLAKSNERPAGIYMWCVFAPGPLAAGMALFMEEMAAPRYTGVNLYSRPNTDLGIRFNETLGLTQGVQIGPIAAPNIWVFPRTPPVPLYDSYKHGADKHEIGITVARNFEDMMRVAAIRNVVYMGEQECPYFEEYDGNDLSATHLLAYIGDEPIGCLRLRFFADFAKLERLAIRKEFRKSRAAFQLVRAAFKFCQKKGYQRIYAHSQTRLVDFWKRFGFRVLEGGKSFVFSGFDYVEVIADFERDADSVTIGDDPYLIIRPEGRWHLSGVLEQSASIAAARFSAEEESLLQAGSQPFPKPEVA